MICSLSRSGVTIGRLARSEERSEARSEARSEEKEFRNIGDEQDQRSKPEEQARVEVGAIVSSLVDRAEQEGKDDRKKCTI